MRPFQSCLSVAALLMFALAGCVGQADAVQKDQSSATAGAGATGEADPDAGSIRGRVLSDELDPLANASVALQKPPVDATTDSLGAFALVGLPAGTYTLYAQKLGYQAHAGVVKVEARTTSWTNITLTRVTTDAAFFQTQPRTEIIQCMVNAAAWVSACTYPYTAVYLAAHNNGVNLSNYGAPDDLQHNMVRYNFTVGYGFMGGITDVVWTPTSANANLLMSHVCRTDYDPVLDGCNKDYGNADGKSPLNYEWKLEKADLPKAPGQITWVLSALWPSFNGDPGVILDQKVTTYNTEFFGGPPPDGWSVFNQTKGP